MHRFNERKVSHSSSIFDITINNFRFISTLTDVDQPSYNVADSKSNHHDRVDKLSDERQSPLDPRPPVRILGRFHGVDPPDFFSTFGLALRRAALASDLHHESVAVVIDLECDIGDTLSRENQVL